MKKEPGPFFVGVCAAVAIAVSLSAQESRPAPQFTIERPVVSGRGPHRLRVDVPLLVGAQPRTLNDLRLYNAGGVEIPRLMVWPPSPVAKWIGGRVAAIPTTAKTSGFEVDLGDAFTIDRIRLTGIPGPFMKLANLEGSGDRSRWTVLIDQTTVFDLPDNGLQRLELGFPAGPYRYIRVTWNDTNSARAPLPSAVDARERTNGAEPPAPLTGPVGVERRPSEPGMSRYRLHLPGPRLPIVAIDLNIDGDYVLRRVTVTESRLYDDEVAPVVISKTILRRDTRGAAGATSLRIPVGASTEPVLDLTIEDGDNPPLNVKSAAAVFGELPWIYFEGDGGNIVARYGDPKLPPPQYDLEAARASLHIEAVPDATWGEPHALAPTQAAASTAPMPTGGAPIDAAMFRYTRPVPAGEPGLIAVVLDAAALSHSAGPGGRFGDVRVIDPARRQVPYVLERRDEPLMMGVSLDPRDAPASARNGARPGVTSYYRIRLPFAGLPSPRLVLTTTSRVFDRHLGVIVERPADERHRDAWLQPIASVRWTHTDRETAAPLLTVQLPTTDTTELLVVVVEGDNTRLAIASGQLLLPSYRIRLYRENGEQLRMVYGRGDIEPPRYDLALLAPQVLGVAAREVNPAAEEAGPALQPNKAVVALLSPRLFWGVLVLCVVALLGLLTRLLKHEPPAEFP